MNRVKTKIICLAGAALLLVGCSSRLVKKEPVLLQASEQSSCYTIHAPRESDVVEIVPFLDIAVRRLKTFFGDSLPAIEIFLFDSNEDLMNYDYSRLQEQEIFCRGVDLGGHIV